MAGMSGDKSSWFDINWRYVFTLGVAVGVELVLVERV